MSEIPFRMYDKETKDLSTKEIFSYLLGGIGPRPIALVSTLSPKGICNLSPFSFFNAFGANPPVIAFSASRRVRDNTTKHTYDNLITSGECVVQAVTYDIVQQVSLSSTEYPENVDEFIKSGLTAVPSDMVAPPRVAESPFQMECKLQQMIELGGEAGSGNLAICEVLKFHIAESLLGDNPFHPDKLDLVSRMGANFYCRASGDAIFEIKKPLTTLGIGYDQLPSFLRDSDIFTANNLGQFANSETIPANDDVLEFVNLIDAESGDDNLFTEECDRGDFESAFAIAIHVASENPVKGAKFCFLAAKTALERDETEFAWKAALYGQYLVEGKDLS